MTRCSSPGCPRKASCTAYPFARLQSTLSSLLLRDPPSRGASAPIELCSASARAFRRRATKAKDTSGRRLQSYIFKTEHPLFRAAIESLAGVAPGAPEWTLRFTPQSPASVGAINPRASILLSPWVTPRFL